MKDLCVIKFKDGRYAIRKMDCNLDFLYLDLYETFWWRYSDSENFKNCYTTDSKEEIFKRFDEIRNNIVEENSAEVIKSFLYNTELD